MDTSNLDAGSIVESMGRLVSTWGLKVVGAIAVLIIGMIVAKMIRGAARKSFARANMDATLVPFLSGIIYYLVLGCVVIAVMGMFGIQTTSFIAVLGAAGLAVGLAMQGTLSNFSAGVMLLIFRPFRAGDFVDAAGTSGTVKEVGVFSTTLCSPDNVMIIVPNSAIYGATIKNFSANDTRRNDLVIGVGYGDDLQVATDTINRVLASDERVLKDPAPTVAVSELADSSVNFVVRPWCTREDYWGLRFDLTRKIKQELEAAGCSIPFPQRDVHLHQVTSSAA
jgi:small conductance mechanosensitive channel